MFRTNNKSPCLSFSIERDLRFLVCDLLDLFCVFFRLFTRRCASDHYAEGVSVGCLRQGRKETWRDSDSSGIESKQSVSATASIQQMTSARDHCRARISAQGNSNLRFRA